MGQWCFVRNLKESVIRFPDLLRRFRTSLLVLVVALSAQFKISANERTNWSDQKSVLTIIRSLKAPYPDDLAPAKGSSSIDNPTDTPLETEVRRRLNILGEIKINLMGLQNLVFDHPYVIELRYIALNDEQLTVRAEALRTLQAIALRDLSEGSTQRLKTVKANTELSHLTEVQVLELMVSEVHDRLGIHRPQEDAKSKLDSPVIW